MSTRLNNRQFNELRAIKITRNYTKYAEGSVLIEFGDTKVLCNATIDESVPPFLKNKNQGWLTAEYSMLPRATHERTKRDAVVGKVNSRAQEISRLIGRSLRSCVNFNLLGSRQILVDCDVIQADGGTRTASITGAYIAVYDAINLLLKTGKIMDNPITSFIAAISVGVYQGEPLLDLDYMEDSACDTDMNIIMNENLSIIEIQGTAENTPLDRLMLGKLMDLSEHGIKSLINLQKQALNLK